MLLCNHAVDTRSIVPLTRVPRADVSFFTVGGTDPSSPGSSQIDVQSPIIDVWGILDPSHPIHLLGSHPERPPAWPGECVLARVEDDRISASRRRPATHPPRFISVIMTPDAALELSVEQLIDTLNKKLSIECTRVQSAMPPTSRALVATLTAEVRAQELE